MSIPGLRLFTSWSSSKLSSPLFRHEHTARPDPTAALSLEKLNPAWPARQ